MLKRVDELWSPIRHDSYIACFRQSVKVIMVMVKNLYVMIDVSVLTMQLQSLKQKK
jgi:hypothetical protein